MSSEGMTWALEKLEMANESELEHFALQPWIRLNQFYRNAYSNQT